MTGRKAGTTLTKATSSNTQCRHGFKSCSAWNVLLLKPEHIQVRLKSARDHLAHRGLGQCGQIRPKWKSLAWTLLAVGWKHHSWGDMMYCEKPPSTSENNEKETFSMTIIPNYEKSISRFWCSLASLVTPIDNLWMDLKVCFAHW